MRPLTLSGLLAGVIDMIDNYSNVVSVEERDGNAIIKIHRLIGGKMDFYTQMDLEHSEGDVDWDAFDKFATLLGKTIFIDSQKIGQSLGIEAEADKYEASNPKKAE